MLTARSARRVAVLSDAHGNAVALEAVLADLPKDVDLVVSGGDLTWGPLPEETRALVEQLPAPALFVRGNAERALLRCVEQVEAGQEARLSARESWMARRHSRETRAFLARFVEQVVVEIDGLGPVRFCHGSPRSARSASRAQRPSRASGR